MRQFARCSNCQQWYLHTYTDSVEIYEHNRLCALAVWCFHCMAMAEQRSQPLADAEAPSVATALSQHPLTRTDHTSPETAALTFEALMQAHAQLLDRALYDDEAVLIPAVQAFIDQCHGYAPAVDSPEKHQRLTGHARYWCTFLQACKPTS